MNVNLNAGGVIGALLFGALTGGLLIAFGMDQHLAIRLAFGALIAGAFAGNFGWGLLFDRSRDRETDRQGTALHDDEDDDLGQRLPGTRREDEGEVD